MSDLFDLVLRYYYDPEMRDSNSIKKVLPATLNNSAFLKANIVNRSMARERHREPQFTDGKSWVVFDEAGRVIDRIIHLPACSMIST